MIAGILAFMLTSGDWVRTRSFVDAYFNPTYLPMVALRTAVAVGLAGLYVLFAASFLRDATLKARVARWSATRWIVPAAVLVPLALLWYLSAAAGAGVAVAETLGAKSASPAAVLAAVFSAGRSGHPIVRGAARVAVAGTAMLVVASLALVALRARRYGRLEAGLLMVLGLVSMGGSEWVREGLRKPWVIDRYMFVNGVRVPAPAGGAGAAAAPVDDPFALDALDRRGVLATSPWVAAPAAWRPGDPAFEGLPVAERAGLEAEAGREVFRIECAVCHTERGHLGVRRLVRGRASPRSRPSSTRRRGRSPPTGGPAPGPTRECASLPGSAAACRPSRARTPRSAPWRSTSRDWAATSERAWRCRRPEGAPRPSSGTARPVTARSRPGPWRTGCGAARPRSSTG